MKLSITIITLNEEKNIGRCINSVAFADEVIVVDSKSSDKTRKIAEKLGAKVYDLDFQGYGQQKNHAASLCSGEWILNIDADEEVTDQLKESILTIINNEKSKNVYKINRITSFCNKWIKHGGWYPDFATRLYRRSFAKWTEPSVHEELLPINANEEVGLINSNLNHYSFPTIQSQIKTNIKYATLGAKDLLQRKQRKPFIIEILTRPFFKFLECYLFKLGFLDGIQGFIIAINAAHSMFMKYSIAYIGKSED